MPHTGTNTDGMDIREWAAQRGIEVRPKGPVPRDVRTAYYAEQVGGEVPPPPPAEPSGEAPPGSGETPPEVKRPWWKRDRKEPGERGKSGRRTPVDQIVGLAWEFGAFALSQEPRMLPVARCVSMQAPVAGLIIDEAVKGTVADKVLQPIARAGEAGEKMFGLIGPPLIVAAITGKPELFPVLRPALKMSLMQWMFISEPAMKKAEKRSRDWAERFGGVDIDGMIDQLFAPPEGALNPQEEANIRRAREAG
jgi:hypothetical protein